LADDWGFGLAGLDDSGFCCAWLSTTKVTKKKIPQRQLRMSHLLGG
jgi:hypothetical protein